MQDYWNDPPDDQEPPEWYMTLEDVLEQQDPPESVATTIRKAMDDWVEEYNQWQDFEPIDDPKLIEGEYLRDSEIAKQYESP